MRGANPGGMKTLAIALLAVGLAGEANAEGDYAKFDTGNMPGTPATNEINTTGVGLFCGSEKLHGGKIVVYVYGIGLERLETGEPLAATFDIDGKATEFSLKPLGDLALAPTTPAFVRSLLHGRSASVSIKGYVSPAPEKISLDNAESKDRSALKKCYRF
jgi:hypothetical protein